MPSPDAPTPDQPPRVTPPRPLPQLQPPSQFFQPQSGQPAHGSTPPNGGQRPAHRPPRDPSPQDQSARDQPLPAAEPAPSGHRRRAVRLTPESVRRRDFARSPLGRRGYLESDVDRFRLLVADEIAYADAEKAELRGELNRLRNYFRDNRIDPAALPQPEGRPDDPRVPSVQAVNMMSMAQQAADQHIAQAETYAREMVGDARRQYEHILRTAQLKAQEAADEAQRAVKAAESISGRTASSDELESKITYLRTFAEVTQVQMRAILQALGQELDRLSVNVADNVTDNVPPSVPTAHSMPTVQSVPVGVEVIRVP